LDALQAAMAALQTSVTALEAQAATLQSSVNVLLPLLDRTAAIRSRQEDEMFNLLLIEKATRKTNA
jgi:hypothetical protein